MHVEIRETLKAIARAAATCLVAPMMLSFWLRSLLIGRDRALEGSSQALAFLPGIAGQYVRRAFLGVALAECHPTATISFGTVFSRAGARIEAHAYLGPGCHVGLVHIERDVLIGAGVHLPSGGATHGTDDVSRPIREQSGAQRLVRIGRGSWIGSAAVVMADIGHDSVVGAGSVVTRTIPPLVVAAGVPAKPIKSRRALESVAV